MLFDMTAEKTFLPEPTLIWRWKFEVTTGSHRALVGRVATLRPVGLR